MLLRIELMRRKNKPTVGLLFLSILYMVFCCLIFFSLALVIVELIMSHKVSFERSDIEHVVVVSVIAGTAAALRSWIFAKIDERNARKSQPSDP